jgi:hypothetical protein
MKFWSNFLRKTTSRENRGKDLKNKKAKGPKAPAGHFEIGDEWPWKIRITKCKFLEAKRQLFSLQLDISDPHFISSRFANG